MPVTPLHLGPGAAFKLLLGPRLSLSVFAFSQLLMDIEVLARVLLGSPQWHGFSNSLLGALVLLLPSAWLGRPLCESGLRWWNRNLSPGLARHLSVSAEINRQAAWNGALLGVFSHVLLDAIMHADAQPLAPFSEANPFLGWLSVSHLNLLCLFLLACALLYGAFALWRRN